MKNKNITKYILIGVDGYGLVNPDGMNIKTLWNELFDIMSYCIRYDSRPYIVVQEWDGKHAKYKYLRYNSEHIDNVWRVITRIVKYGYKSNM